MKTRLSVLILIAVLVLAVPAGAKQHETVGEKISVMSCVPETFQAGEPFHIRHGWLQAPRAAHPIGLWTFELDIDGVPRDADYVEREAEPGDAVTLLRVWVHNFPDGMEAGTYTFDGRWLGPCETPVGPDHGGGQCQELQIETTCVVELTE